MIFFIFIYYMYQILKDFVPLPEEIVNNIFNFLPQGAIVNEIKKYISKEYIYEES